MVEASCLVPTARGDAVSSADLGFTLMHEHTFCLSPEVNLNYPETWSDEENRVEAAIEEYRELKLAGVDTVVDVTVVGLGRYIPRVQRIADAVDLNLVVATGVYIWDALPMFFAGHGPGTAVGGPEFMDEMFVRDIEEGIAETGIKAGILKVATHAAGLTADVERVLRATAMAHRRTGTPITTHTHGAPNGLDQQRIFSEEGVDLTRVVIGHVQRDAVSNPDYIEQLLAKGSTLGFDQLWPNLVRGLPAEANVEGPHAGSLERELDAVADLCQRGYGKQIVLSHDHCCYVDMAPPGYPWGSWHKTFIPTEVLPALRARSVSEADIVSMTIENPRRIFGSAGRV